MEMVKKELQAQVEENKEEGEDTKMSAAMEISATREEQIEKETVKKLRRDRVIEGGIKMIREKCPFVWN